MPTDEQTGDFPVESKNEESEHNPKCKLQNTPFKIATWNIRGLNKQGRREAIARFMNLHNIDILAIQESKIPHSSKETLNIEYSETGGKMLLDFYHSSKPIMKTSTKG